jgi:polyisoprenoid-binding protein YceI
VETDPAGNPRHLEVTIDAASIDADVADRDAHLRSPDFFDVARYPTITFRSTGVTPTGTGATRVEGELTLRGQSRPVTFSATVEPAVTDPWGNRRIAGQATGKLNRQDWGLTWNQVLEAGGLLVSEEVRFILEIEVVLEPSAAAA